MRTDFSCYLIYLIISLTDSYPAQYRRAKEFDKMKIELVTFVGYALEKANTISFIKLRDLLLLISLEREQSLRLEIGEAF